jgi:hypothetical protein
MTAADIAAVLGKLNAYAYAQGAGLAVTAEDLYFSEKVPFAFNYVDRRLDVTHDNDNMGDHGTHVAGIAAANALDTTGVVGMAPDAQLLIMKVFGANGGAYMDDVACALEDAMLLGADVVNASLGSSAGFSDSGYAMLDEIYANLKTSGMIVKVDLGADAYGKEDTFLPGLVSIGDILKKEGYRQELLLGSYAMFHGREVYFREHGGYEILQHSGCDRVMQELIQSRFGFPCPVRFLGTLELRPEDEAIKALRERAEKADQEIAAAAAAAAAAAPSSGGGGGEEAKSFAFSFDIA